MRLAMTSGGVVALFNVAVPERVVFKGQTLSASATVTPDTVPDKSVTSWVIANTGVASVSPVNDSTCNIKGLSVGKTTLNTKLNSLVDSTGATVNPRGTSGVDVIDIGISDVSTYYNATLTMPIKDQPISVLKAATSTADINNFSFDIKSGDGSTTFSQYFNYSIAIKSGLPYISYTFKKQLPVDGLPLKLVAYYKNVDNVITMTEKPYSIKGLRAVDAINVSETMMVLFDGNSMTKTVEISPSNAYLKDIFKL